MAGGSVSKAVLCVANVFYAVAGLAVAAVGAWFFVQLNELMILRNINHYYLNYRVYWVQVIPWLFMIVGVVLLCVAFCGWCAAGGRNRGALLMYIVTLLFTIVSHVLLATLVFVYADGENTDKFVTDTMLDAFYNSQTNDEALQAFGNIERKYYCCGATEPRDYRKTRSDFPLSCCDERAFPPASTCEFTNNRANDRHGCAKVAQLYAKIAMKYLAVGSVIVGLLEVIGLVVAFRLYRKPKHEKVSIQESESKKVLL